MEPFRILGNVYFVGTFQALSHLIDTGENLFLDDKIWGQFLDHCEKRLDNVIAKEGTQDAT